MNDMVVAFAGQGAQKVGMAADIPQNNPWFTQASEILGYDLWALCNQGPKERLQDTRFAQAAMFVTCYALWDNSRDQLSPKYFAGHSLGAITAMCAAGSLSFSDGVNLVAERGRLMGSSDIEGGMLAILGLDQEVLEHLCGEVRKVGWVEMANFNSPGQIVVSGEKEALAMLAEVAQGAGARRVVPLDVSGPFHSRLMEPAAEKFSEFLAGIPLSDPAVPIVSNSANRLLTTGEEIRQELIQQLTSPVYWIDNIKLLEHLGATHFVEISPSPVLIGLVKRITKGMKLGLVATMEGIE